MAQALAKKLGVTLEIVPTTWKSMTGDFKAGRFDIAMGGVSVTPSIPAGPMRPSQKRIFRTQSSKHFPTTAQSSMTWPRVMAMSWSLTARRSTTRRVRHRGVLCPAAVRHAFDHFAKAYWMTRNPAPKAAVDAVLKKSLDAGDYQSPGCGVW
jgi:cyclohexadienyl dehydratase